MFRFVCFVFLLSSLSFVFTDEYISNGPEQVHISYGAGYSQMYVTWLTQQRLSGQPLVEFGIQSGKYDRKSYGNMTKFTTAYTRYVYRVALENLEPNMTYCNHFIYLFFV